MLVFCRCRKSVRELARWRWNRSSQLSDPKMTMPVTCHSMSSPLRSPPIVVMTAANMSKTINTMTVPPSQPSKTPSLKRPFPQHNLVSYSKHSQGTTTMIDHIGIVVSNLAKSAEFYSKALAPISYVEKANYHVVIGYGSSAPSSTPSSNTLPEAHSIPFWISQTKTPNQPISPVHIAFAADSTEKVDAFYEAAIKAGGKDNGKPGLRPQYHPGYYGAFVLDLDGHNVEVVFHGAKPSQ